MTLHEAKSLMLQGHRVWRTAWGLNWHYVTTDQNGKLIMNDPMNGIEDRVGGVDLVRVWKFEPTEDDLMAVDWEIATPTRAWR
jgi:hypothetical protein